MALTRLGPNQAVNLSTNTTGTLGVANGGTGLTSGTTDQLLKFTGSTTLASSAISTGKILQVQYDNKASTASTTDKASSGNYADLLSVDITPSATSSKIMISAMVTEGASSSSDGSCILRCLRDSTPIAGGTASGSRISSTTGRKTASADANTINSESITWIDTPSTTSQVTYKVQFASRGGGSGTAYIGQTANDSNSSEHQRTSCNLTLFEIGA